MKAILRKTLFVALPLAGLLLTAPSAFAGPGHHHRHWKRHYQHDCHPRYNQGWRESRRSYDDYYYRRGWYNGRRYNDDYYWTGYPRPFYSNPWRYNYNYR